MPDDLDRILGIGSHKPDSHRRVGLRRVAQLAMGTLTDAVPQWLWTVVGVSAAILMLVGAIPGLSTVGPWLHRSLGDKSLLLVPLYVVLFFMASRVWRTKRCGACGAQQPGTVTAHDKCSNCGVRWDVDVSGFIEPRWLVRACTVASQVFLWSLLIVALLGWGRWIFDADFRATW